MAKKINDLPSATPALTDLIEISQSPHSAGTSKNTTLADVKTLFSDIIIVQDVWDSVIIKSLNSSPRVLASPSDVGKFIFVENIILESDAGTAYDTNTNLRFGNASGKAQFGNDNFLTATSATKVRGVPLTQDGGLYNPQYVPGEDLLAYVETGDPASGDFNVKVMVFYREVIPQI